MRLELELEGHKFVPGETIVGKARIHLDEPFEGVIRVIPVWEIGKHIRERSPLWGGSTLFEGALLPGYYEYAFQGTGPPGPFTTNGEYVDIKTRMRLEVVRDNDRIVYEDVDYRLCPGPLDGSPRHYKVEDVLELEVRSNTPAPRLWLDLPESFPPGTPSMFRVTFFPPQSQEISNAAMIFEGIERFAVPPAPLVFQLHHGFHEAIPLDFGTTQLVERERYQVVTSFTPPPVCSYHGQFNQILWRARVVIQGPQWTVNEVFPIVVHPPMRPEVVW